MPAELPLPSIDKHESQGIVVLSDDSLFDATGVRIAFSSRVGGVSTGAYGALDLGNHVGDDATAVERNRDLLLRALDSSPDRCIFANQVHGDKIVAVAADADDAALERAKAQANEEADGIIVECPDVAALLCFADCVPVIVVAPTGAFAVVHAGWRGVMARIAPKAVRMLAGPPSAPEGMLPSDPSTFNVYIGPHIHGECFETSADIRDRFACGFGEAVCIDDRHVGLADALRVSLQEAGIVSERICDVGICTRCNAHEYFSYRASGGTCGRHAAVAIRHRMDEQDSKSSLSI